MTQVNDTIRRELCQLWYIAEYYLKLAGDEKGSCNKKVTFRQLADECDLSHYSNHNHNCLNLSAHLHSCAVRLWSIDEVLWKHDKKDRRKCYDEIHYNFHKKTNKTEGLWKNPPNAKKAVENKLNMVIHSVLRNLSGHGEYDNTLDVIGGLSLEQAFNSMVSVSNKIKSDLEDLRII